MIVIVAALYFRALKRQVKTTARLQQQSEEQVRRELAQPMVSNPSEPRVKAKLFWASGPNEPTLAPVIVELPLSDDPVVRAKQVLNTLLAGPVDTDLRTLPPDAVLLEFYLLPDGTGVADFSEAMGTAIPSGIESEQLAVDSITRTIEANVPQVQRLKILIHGQEVDTLAGHLDLTGTFVVNAKPAPLRPVAAAAVTPQPTRSDASNTPQGQHGDGKLTPNGPTVKLAQPPQRR
ncbi:MAG: hypothetical protein C5B58_10460 [Acidobacteria bacterium]|nr:MAG: hypothetical protein C5B58_10460 [Acidobacteriota bacterium]